MGRPRINGLTPTLSRALAVCTQFRAETGRYPTPVELTRLLPPVLDRGHGFRDRPMRAESALRLIERLKVAGHLNGAVGLLRQCDDLLGRLLPSANGHAEEIAELRREIAAVNGSTT